MKMKTLIQRYLDMTSAPLSGNLILPTAWKFLPGKEKEAMLGRLGLGRELTVAPGSARNIYIVNGYACVITSCGHEEFTGPAYELYLRLEFWFDTLPPLPVPLSAEEISRREETAARHAAMRAEGRSSAALKARLARLESQIGKLSSGPAKSATQGEVQRIKNQLATA